MPSSVSIAIIQIKEDEFVFKPDNIKKIDPKKLDIVIHVGFDWNIEKEQFFVILTVFYNYKINGVEIELSKFVTTTGFEVKGLKDIIKIEEKDFELQDIFMLTFVGTAFSNARGMLTYKLSGTILADFYLPLIDPKDILGHVKEEKKTDVSKQSPPKKTTVKKVPKKINSAH